MNETAVNNDTLEHSVAGALTPLKGLLMLVGVVAAIAIFIALNHALGLAEFWVAFLFLLYWSGVEQMRFEKLPHCIVGASIGLLMGYLMQTLPIIFGAAGGLIFLGIILLLIYGQIMHWLPLAINMMTMLFLTVATVPALQAGIDFGNVVAALALGIVYFVGLIAMGKRIQKHIAGRR